MDIMIFDKRNRRFGMMFIFALLLSSIEYTHGQVSLSGCANPVVYSSCDLTCQTPDQSADAVKFFKPPNLSSVIAQCTAGGTCGALTGYSIQRSTPTTTVFTILNYTCTDSVTWRCDYNSNFATHDSPCVDFPQTATTTDISDNSVLNSSVVITVNLGCLVSQGTVQMKFDYKNSGGTIVDSSALSTCSNVSTCTDPLYSTYECQINLRKESNILCETKYSIEANVKISDAVRTESIHLLNDVEFTCPTTQMNTIFLTDGMTTTTNYIIEYNNVTQTLMSGIFTPTTEMFATSSFVSEYITQNSFNAISTSRSSAEMFNTTLFSRSSDNSLKYNNGSEIISTSLTIVTSTVFTSNELHTETTLSVAFSSKRFLMSDLEFSDFDSLTDLNLFSSQTDSVFSPTIYKSTVLDRDSITSGTLFSVPEILSVASSTITKLPTVLSTSISISNVNSYSNPLNSKYPKTSSNELFENRSEISENISVLTSYRTTTHLFTSYTSQSIIGLISKTEITFTESYFERTDTYLTIYQHIVSDTVGQTIHSYASNELTSQTLKTTRPIINIDTSVHVTDNDDSDTTKWSKVLQTFTHASTVSIFPKHPFSSEISKLSTILLPGMTLHSTLLESSIYSSRREDDTMTTEVQNSGFPSSISINLSQSIGTSISMKTINSFLSTFVFSSSPTTTATRIVMSDYLQSSFYPNDQDLSLRTTEYYVTTMQSADSFLVSSTEKNSLNVNSKMRTIVSETKSSVHTIHNPDMLTVQNYSSIRTIVEQPNPRTKSEFEHLLNSSMSNYYFSRTIDVSSFITTEHSKRNSFPSLLYSSGSSNVVLSTSTPFLFATSSADFKSTTIHSTSNTIAGISETTKSAIFITIVSVIVIIIILFSSIMLLSRVTFEKKTVNVSLSNEGQFPYMKRAIYPRFSDSLSSYMTSPYERNWHEV